MCRIKPRYVQGLVPSVLSGIHWASWNKCPGGGGWLVHIYTACERVPTIKLMNPTITLQSYTPPGPTFFGESASGLLSKQISIVTVQYHHHHVRSSELIHLVAESVYPTWRVLRSGQEAG